MSPTHGRRIPRDKVVRHGWKRASGPDRCPVRAGTLTTPEAWAALIKNPHNRHEDVRPIFESLGGRYDHAWFAPNDAMFVGICDVPDQEAMAAVNLAVQASGAASSIRIIPLMSPVDAVRIYELAGSIGYRPPG